MLRPGTAVSLRKVAGRPLVRLLITTAAAVGLGVELTPGGVLGGVPNASRGQRQPTVLVCTQGRGRWPGHASGLAGGAVEQTAWTSTRPRHSGSMFAAPWPRNAPVAPGITRAAPRGGARYYDSPALGRVAQRRWPADPSSGAGAVP